MTRNTPDQDMVLKAGRKVVQDLIRELDARHVFYSWDTDDEFTNPTPAGDEWSATVGDTPGRNGPFGKQFRLTIFSGRGAQQGRFLVKPLIHLGDYHLTVAAERQLEQAFPKKGYQDATATVHLIQQIPRVVAQLKPQWDQALSKMAGDDMKLSAFKATTPEGAKRMFEKYKAEHPGTSKTEKDFLEGGSKGKDKDESPGKDKGDSKPTHVTPHKDLGNLLEGWHESGSDPIYAVSSNARAGKPVPAEMAQKAMSKIDTMIEHAGSYGISDKDKKQLSKAKSLLEKSLGKKARFEEGESVDVPAYLREHGNPEAAQVWIDKNEEHRDKFKQAARIPKGNFALVKAQGLDDTVLSVHQTKEQAEAAMRKKGGEPDSLFQKGMRIVDVSPTGRNEIIEVFGKLTIRPKGRAAAAGGDSMLAEMDAIMAEGCPDNLDPSECKEWEANTEKYKDVVKDQHTADLDEAEFDMLSSSFRAASEIGKIILEQMGGGSRLKAMLGVSQIVFLPRGLSFTWPNRQRSKGNTLRVTLDPDDTYTLEFLNTAGYDQKLVKKYEGIYADQIPELFYRQTGWALRLACDNESLDAAYASMDKYTSLGDDYLALEEMWEAEMPLLDDEPEGGIDDEDFLLNAVDEEVACRMAAAPAPVKGEPSSNGSGWKLVTTSGPKRWTWDDKDHDTFFQVVEVPGPGMPLYSLRVLDRSGFLGGQGAFKFRKSLKRPEEAFARARALYRAIEGLKAPETMGGGLDLTQEWVTTQWEKMGSLDEADHTAEMKRPGPYIEIEGKPGTWRIVSFSPHKDDGVGKNRTIGEVAWGRIQKTTKDGNTTGREFEIRFFDKGNKVSVAWTANGKYLSSTYKAVEPPKGKSASYEVGEVTEGGYENGQVTADPAAVESTEGSQIPDGEGNTEKRAAGKIKTPFTHEMDVVGWHISGFGIHGDQFAAPTGKKFLSTHLVDMTKALQNSKRAMDSLSDEEYAAQAPQAIKNVTAWVPGLDSRLHLASIDQQWGDTIQEGQGKTAGVPTTVNGWLEFEN